MKYLYLVLSLCLFSQGAWAGWVVTYKDAETGERTQEFYDGGSANFGDMVIADGRIVAIDQASKSYWKGTTEQYCNGVKSQIQRMQSMMPAQFRPKPISQQQVTRKKLGSKSIAGFSATGWEFYVDGSQSGQIWVSSDSGLDDLIDLGRTQWKKMKCLEDMDRMWLEGSKLYRQTIEGAFILKESHRQVISVEKKSVSSDRFKAPGGYKVFSDYDQFMDYASNNSNSSSQSAPSSFDMDSFEKPQSRQEENRQTQREEGVVEKDARDIGQGAVDEAHQSTKQGIQKGLSEDIQGGVEKLLDKWGF